MISNRASFLRACSVAALVVACFLAAEAVTRVWLFGPDAFVHPARYSPRGNALTEFVMPNDDPVVNYRLRPGISGNFKGGPFSVNEDGYRGNRLAIPKPPGVFRIASLGASITMGSGVADDEDYSAQLQTLLDQRFPRRFEVINASIGGFSAKQIAALYDQSVAKYSPDLILFPVFYSGYQALDDPVPATYPPLRSRLPGWTDLRGYLIDSFFYQGMRDSARTWLNRFLALDWLVRDRPAPGKQDTTADELSRFVAGRRADGITVCVLVLHRVNEESPDTDEIYRRRLDKWIEANPGSCLIDTVPALRGKVGMSDRIYWGDNHPNARVHRLYAEEILRALTMRGIAR